MSNKYTPHLHILPEDDANKEFANGFLLDDRIAERNVQVLKPAGGWRKAVGSIENCGLLQHPERRLLVLIDFDEEVERRLPEVLAGIPPDIKQRVYVLGVASNPERLRVAMGKSLEQIGLEMAQQCAEKQDEVWEHELLTHNRGELARLVVDVREIVIR